MPPVLERFWAWLHTREGTKIFRYSMVSVISTGCSFATLFVVFGVLRLWSEVPSTVFANGLATFPSYWLNRQWAWGKSGRSHVVKEIVPFWVMAALGIAFSIVGASVARHLGQTHHLDHLAQTGLVLLANITSFAIFWVAKLMVFNRLFHVPTLLEEIDEHIDEQIDEQIEDDVPPGARRGDLHSADPYSGAVHGADIHRAAIHGATEPEPEGRGTPGMRMGSPHPELPVT